MAKPTIKVNGTVQQSNDNGVKLNGSWYNFSKFGFQGPGPEAGTNVEMTIADDKFIKALTVLGGAPAPKEASTGAGALAGSNRGYAIEDLAKDKRISRLSLIGSLSKARPDLFTADKVEEAIELVRNLEVFVYEGTATPETFEDSCEDVIDDAEDMSSLPY